MKKTFTFSFWLIGLVLFEILETYGQSYSGGFETRIFGSQLEYWSFHPEPGKACLVRNNADSPFIEWESASVPVSIKSETVSFVLLSNYNVSTAKENHRYSLKIGDNETIEFQAGKDGPVKDWKIEKENISLRFQVVERDHVGDVNGFLFITVPCKWLDKNRKIRFRLSGENTKSSDWFMIFQKNLQTKFTLIPQAVVQLSTDSVKRQAIKLLFENYNMDNLPITIYEGKKKILNQSAIFGINAIDIPCFTSNIDIIKEFSIQYQKQKITQKVTLKAFKPYTVYLIPHSHLDIGYTHPQEEVLNLQVDVLKQAIKLIEKTKDYPVGSQYKFSIESLWVLEEYLKQASEYEKGRFIQFAKEGRINVQGFYLNLNTGLANAEELFQLVNLSSKVSKEYGIPINSATITDIPGAVAGIIPVMAQNGIRYFCPAVNSFDRIGNTLSTWGDKPFWWKSTSEKEKVLVWMSSPGYNLFHKWFIGEKKNINPILDYLSNLEKKKYPYNFSFLSYTTGGDNGPNDSLLSGFIREWNQKYSSPKLIISTFSEVFQKLEKEHGNEIPTYKGDLSPYWEDGAYSTAYETVTNRKTAAELIHLETTATLLNKQLPDNTIRKCWNNVLLFNEHTWGAHNSIDEPEGELQTKIWNGKKQFMLRALELKKIIADSLNSGSSRLQLFNSQSFPFNGLAFIQPAQSLGSEAKDQHGNIYSVQTLSNGKTALQLQNVEPYSSITLAPTFKKTKKNKPVLYRNGILSNDKLKVTLDTLSGNILTIQHFSKGFYDFSESKGLNQFIYTEQDAKNPVSDKVDSIRITEKGNLLLTVTVFSKAKGCKSLTRSYTLVDGDEQLYIENKIDKAKVLTKENVRFYFPFNISNPVVKAEQSWGIYEPEKDQLPGANKNYFTIGRWVNFFNPEKNITLFSPDATLCEFGKMTAENWFNNQDKQWMQEAILSSDFYSWVMNNSWHTNFAAYQEDPVTFRYSIFIQQKPDFAELFRKASTWSNPMVSVRESAKDHALYIPELTNENLIISSITPVKNGFKIRVYNPAYQTEKTMLRFRQMPVTITDSSNGSLITGESKIEFKPFEIINFNIRLPE
jgi:alpha-mannosidase